MKQSNRPNLGIMFRREYPPETLPAFTRQAEAAGFDELYVVEDCFYTSGIASAATALACTTSLNVGLGIMPAVVRNPAFAAMEIATLARLFPGRFLPGFGHGVADWMRQIGAFPKSQLKALEETALTVRGLLAGEEVTFHGQQVQIEKARLVHPPEQVPPVSLGVIGAKSLALAGRSADGVILSEYSSPAYVAWAKEQIAAGKREAGHSRDLRLTIFVFASLAGREKLRPMVAEALASPELDPKLAPLGILEEVQELRERGGQDLLEEKIPELWIDLLAVSGTRADWLAAAGRFAALGADSVVFVPLKDTDPQEGERFGRHLFA